MERLDRSAELPAAIRPARSMPEGMGLRLQLMLALSLGFALSVALLGFATARLGSRAVESQRRSAARAAALAVLRAEPRGPQLAAATDALLEQPGVVGLNFERIGEGELERGRRTGLSVRATHNGREATVWLSPHAQGPAGSLTGLLFLYVGITALAILLLVYVLLTRLIVRPVEELTRASERIAGGRDTVVHIRGAAEVVRLAVAFNRMQSQLGRQRADLEDRVTALSQTTAELRSAETSLVRSEKMASVGRLAAGVAHEIGNPLSAILGLIELCEDPTLDPEERRDYLQRVGRETERIHVIIRDLLNFARAEPDTQEGEGVVATEVVEEAVALVGPQKDMRAIRIERRYEEVPEIRGNANQLGQVLLNLLLNAADAIDGDGSIELEVANAESGWVEIRVTDSGGGIDPAILQEIFEPFVTTKGSGDGTGLGLAVSLSLVVGMGGSLRAENVPSGGARFIVRLPVA